MKNNTFWGGLSVFLVVAIIAVGGYVAYDRGLIDNPFRKEVPIILTDFSSEMDDLDEGSIGVLLYDGDGNPIGADDALSIVRVGGNTYENVSFIALSVNVRASRPTEMCFDSMTIGDTFEYQLPTEVGGDLGKCVNGMSASWKTPRIDVSQLVGDYTIRVGVRTPYGVSHGKIPLHIEADYPQDCRSVGCPPGFSCKEISPDASVHALAYIQPEHSKWMCVREEPTDCRSTGCADGLYCEPMVVRDCDDYRVISEEHYDEAPLDCMRTLSVSPGQQWIVPPTPLPWPPYQCVLPARIEIDLRLDDPGPSDEIAGMIVPKSIAAGKGIEGHGVFFKEYDSTKDKYLIDCSGATPIDPAVDVYKKQDWLKLADVAYVGQSCTGVGMKDCAPKSFCEGSSGPGNGICKTVPNNIKTIIGEPKSLCKANYDSLRRNVGRNVDDAFMLKTGKEYVLIVGSGPYEMNDFPDTRRIIPQVYLVKPSGKFEATEIALPAYGNALYFEKVSTSGRCTDSEANDPVLSSSLSGVIHSSMTTATSDWDTDCDIVLSVNEPGFGLPMYNPIGADNQQGYLRVTPYGMNFYDTQNATWSPVYSNEKWSVQYTSSRPTVMHYGGNYTIWEQMEMCGELITDDDTSNADVNINRRLTQKRGATCLNDIKWIKMPTMISCPPGYATPGAPNVYDSSCMFAYAEGKTLKIPVSLTNVVSIDYDHRWMANNTQLDANSGSNSEPIAEIEFGDAMGNVKRMRLSS